MNYILKLYMPSQAAPFLLRYETEEGLTKVVKDMIRALRSNRHYLISLEIGNEHMVFSSEMFRSGRAWFMVDGIPVNIPETR